MIKQLKVGNCELYLQKASSEMFDRVANTSLAMMIQR